jgi:ATP/maltotriose-dependent transcriptional regulator MalT
MKAPAVYLDTMRPGRTATGSPNRDRHRRDRASSPSSPLERGRACYERRAWADAWRWLSAADRRTPLDAADLERLATVAYLLGRDDEYLRLLERAHDAHFVAGESRRAARCAFWLGLRLFLRGEVGHSTGWLARADRLLDGDDRACVERAYLLLAVVTQRVAAGDLEAAYDAADAAVEVGDRCAEADLSASARQLQGRVLIEQGEVVRGLALLDEAMLAVASGALSPLVAGLAYCGVIDGCQHAFALGRAREWTEALSGWCAAQPDMVAFSGVCLVHRAEIMQWRGAWTDAVDEARRAFERCRLTRDVRAAATALYLEAEVHRLRGALAAAEEAYRGASRLGVDPQPGLALLRAAQGRAAAAMSAIERALRETTDRWGRARLLPAGVEIMLAAGDLDAARRACDELADLACICASAELDALAAAARSAVALAEGDAHAALVLARRAVALPRADEAPYRVARARVLAGVACRALGDEDGSRLELDAARTLFERLGAAPDVARIDALSADGRRERWHGLTPRELQVLRLVAAGKANKGIGAELVLSDRTIERHVSNILAKLDVPSRAAATAYAYEHGLIRSG